MLILVILGLIIGAIVGFLIEKSNYTPIGSEPKKDKETLKEENEQLLKDVENFNEKTEDNSVD
jgi:hypothetical protein